MSRGAVTLRTAGLGDVPFLTGLWEPALRRADPTDQASDVEQLVKQAADSAERRLVIADYAGQPAGAVLLSIGPVNALNAEAAVHMDGLLVSPALRRHGIGRRLMEAAVAYADEQGVGHVISTGLAGSRDGNRFLARLGLSLVHCSRVAPTATVRAKIAAQRPVRVGSPGGQVTKVLAVRRSMRRQSAGR